MDLRVMSFNIRYPQKLDGINYWDHRKNALIDVVRQFNPDIIGFQEVRNEPLEYLKTKLNDYEYYAVPRDDGKVQGEMAPIFFKGCTLVKQGTFWMSPTPDAPGSRFFGERLNRICSWTQLKRGNIEFGMYNTHQSLNKKGQIKSVPLLKEQILKNTPNIPTILMGDFNNDIKSKSYQMLSQMYRDAYLEIPENIHKNEITRHHFTGMNTPSFWDSERKRIDYFWLQGSWRVKLCQIGNDFSALKLPPKVFPSDHYPIIADLTI